MSRSILGDVKALFGSKSETQKTQNQRHEIPAIPMGPQVQPMMQQEMNPNQNFYHAQNVSAPLVGQFVPNYPNTQVGLHDNLSSANFMAFHNKPNIFNQPMILPEVQNSGNQRRLPQPYFNLPPPGLASNLHDFSVNSTKNMPPGFSANNGQDFSNNSSNLHELSLFSNLNVSQFHMSNRIEPIFSTVSETSKYPANVVLKSPILGASSEVTNDSSLPENSILSPLSNAKEIVPTSEKKMFTKGDKPSTTPFKTKVKGPLKQYSKQHASRNSVYKLAAFIETIIPVKDNSVV